MSGGIYDLMSALTMGLFKFVTYWVGHLWLNGWNIQLHVLLEPWVDKKTPPWLKEVDHCLHLDDLRLQLSWQLCLSQSPIFVQSKKRFCILTFSSRVCNYHTVYTPAILSVCHINSSKYAYQVICDAILKRWVKKAHLFAAVLSQLSLML